DQLDGAELVEDRSSLSLRCAFPSGGNFQAAARPRVLNTPIREQSMADISLEAVTGKLNRIGYDTFIQALRQAKGAGNRKVERAHWLAHLLQKDRTDIGLTADHFKLDRAKMLADISA